MMEWDSRMRDNHTVQVLKTVIPFFDVAVGERIDLEGLLTAVRPFARGRERHMLDVVLQFFQMQRMMEMMQLVQSMQQMQQFAGDASGDGQNGSDSPPAMFEMLRSMIPPEQQGMVDMMSAMMAMSDSPELDEDVSPEPPEDKQKEGDHEPVDL